MIALHAALMSSMVVVGLAMFKLRGKKIEVEKIDD